MTGYDDAANGRAACVGHARLFLHPLFDEEDAVSTPERRRRMTGMAVIADGLCRECPVADECLYQAIVRHDVAGFVAGTVPEQRRAIRARLRWTVPEESFDAYAGVVAQRQVDHDEVVRMRRAHPGETLEVIAGRLGCSLSTVKRHLRQARSNPRPEQPRPRLAVVPPSLDQVREARAAVLSVSTGGGTLRRVA